MSASSQSVEDAVRLLFSLAHQQLDEITKVVGQLSVMDAAVMLIEVCRYVDQAHVVQEFWTTDEAKLRPQDFDIVARGWNVLVSHLLPLIGHISAIPLFESTQKSQQVAMSLLHAGGRTALLKRMAESVSVGIVDATMIDGRIELALSSTTVTDHFRDYIDNEELAVIERELFGSRGSSHSQDINRIRQLMAKQTFPWRTTKGCDGRLLDNARNRRFLYACCR